MGTGINLINTTTLYYINNKLVGMYDPTEGQCIAIKTGQGEVKQKLEAEIKVNPKVLASEPQGLWSNLAYWLFGGENNGIIGCGTNSTPTPIVTVQATDAQQAEEIYTMDIIEDISSPKDVFEVSDGSITGDLWQTVIKLSSKEIATDDRYWNTELQIGPIIIVAPWLKDGKLYFSLESDPTLIKKNEFPNLPAGYNFTSLPCVQGMQNTTTSDPLAFASDPGSRLPISVISRKIVDNQSGKTVLSPKDMYGEMGTEIGAVCGEEKTGMPVKIDVEPSLYTPALLNLNLALSLQIDASSMNAGSHTYLTYLRIRMVIK